MKNLELVSRTAKLMNLNTRAEKHGDEDRVRADLNFQMTITSDDLVRLAPTEATPDAMDRWRNLLFQPLPEKKNGAPFEPQARFREHMIETIAFNRDFPDHRAIIDIDKLRMEFEPSKICKFRLALDDDGFTLVLHFQVQIDPIGHLDDLAKRINSVVVLSIEPPRQQDLVEEAAKTNKVVSIKDKKDPAAAGGRAYPDAVDGTGAELGQPA